MNLNFILKSGNNLFYQQPVTLGLKYKSVCSPLLIGDHGCIRAGTTIYADVQAGNYFQTGHNVLIRENCSFGDHVVVGSGTVLEGYSVFGSFVKIEANCVFSTHVTVGSRVFIGPGVLLTNDKYPLKMRDTYKPSGPIIEDFVTLSAGVIVCPGLTIGRGSFVAAGAVVTKDVPEYTMVMGVPGKFYELPDKLREKNLALNWKGFIEKKQEVQD